MSVCANAKSSLVAAVNNMNNNNVGEGGNNHATGKGPNLMKGVSSSETRDEVLSVGDTSPAWTPRVRLSDLYTRRLASEKLTSAADILPFTSSTPKIVGGYVKIRVDLFSVHALTEFIVYPPIGNGDTDKDREETLNNIGL